MKLSDSAPVPPGPWTSLGIVALLSLVAQLALCQFFSFGERVPVSIDVNPSNLWILGYHFPPTGHYSVLNWLGEALLPNPLNPLSLAASNMSAWCFFTMYAPLMCTGALLAMAVFLRELELSRPAALFGAVIYAWQGDILPFVYPGHYGYMATWTFFALGAWGALRAERTRHWAYALISGASCGLMVGLATNADRGAIASILIGILYLAAIVRRLPACRTAAAQIANLRDLALCVAVATLIALAPLLALFKSNIEGVKLAGTADREQTYQLVTQFSLGPAESLTYLVPGLFGWHSNSPDAPYWGWIGETPGWPKTHQGMRNLNLAISTTGTIATVLALLGGGLLLGGGPVVSLRARAFGRLILFVGAVALVLSWGWHTPFYRSLFALPLMDKWRNPLKWLELTDFALVVLSAFGLQYLLASLDAATPEGKVIRHRVALFTLAATLVLALGFFATYPAALILPLALQAQEYDPASIASILSALHTTTFVALMEVALVCLVLRGLWRPELLRGWKPVNPLLQRAWQAMLKPEHLPMTLALSLSLLAALQLAWVSSQFLVPAPLKGLTETNPLLDLLHNEGDTVRCSVTPQDPVLRDMMLNQFFALDISCLDISAASRIPDDLNTFLQNFTGNEAQLWFLAGVKNVVLPEQQVEQLKQSPSISANIDHVLGFTLEQTPSPDLPSHAVVVMKQYLAKATFMPDAEILPSDEAVLNRLKDLQWDPRTSILLHPTHPLAKIAPPPAAGAPPDELGLILYTPTEINVNVRSARGGFVLIDDQYDPDWTAQVNGRDAEVLRANYILRAVQVPPGDSTVTMKYVAHYQLGPFKPSARAMNNLSDATMLAAWIIAGLALRRRKSTETA